MVTGMAYSLNIKIKRAYEESAEDDGYRVLVDRLWPRGVSKDTIHIDEWCKSVAPSTDLRKWFDHDKEKFRDFTERYEYELDNSDEPAELLERAQAENTKLTLVYAAKDPQINHAVVLRNHLVHLAKNA